MSLYIVYLCVVVICKVWGCGGMEVAALQQKQKAWEKKEIARRIKVNSYSTMCVCVCVLCVCLRVVYVRLCVCMWIYMLMYIYIYIYIYVCVTMTTWIFIFKNGRIVALTFLVCSC